MAVIAVANDITFLATYHRHTTRREPDEPAALAAITVAAAKSLASEMAAMVVVIATSPAWRFSLTMPRGASLMSLRLMLPKAVMAAKSLASEVAAVVIVVAVMAVASDIACLVACHHHCSNKLIGMPKIMTALATMKP